MHLQSLSRSFNLKNEQGPAVYSDHFLFYEDLQEPYECPEHSSGIGMLITRRGNCNYYVNGIKNQVNQNKVLSINRNSLLAIKITEKDSAPTLLFFNSKLPDLVQYSILNNHETLLEEITDSCTYDFSYLERIHYNQHLHETISSLIALGSSCSSFASLKADKLLPALSELTGRQGIYPALIKENDEYTLYWYCYPDSVAEKGRVLKANGKDLFSFTFSMGCPVSISIFSEHGETIVELFESKLPTDEDTIRKHYVGDSKGWIFYLTNLKSVLEGGLDLRNRNKGITNVITA